MAGKSLLAAENYVQVPLIWVKIGAYTFGKYDSNYSGYKKYPNYVQSLEVTKVNGAVNNYSLTLIYPLTQDTDPNFFEKIFSSVSKGNVAEDLDARRIEFTYGDAAMSNFLYRNEVAIITKVSSNFNFSGSVSITYTIEAVSRGALGVSGGLYEPAVYEKPSNIIRKMLREEQRYGLKQLFPGMRNNTLVETLNLIPSEDMAVNIEAKQNISPIAYLEYLVNMMTPDAGNKGDKKTFYVLTFLDDTSGTIDGSYFKICTVDANVAHPEAYEVTVGYPGNNYIFDFAVENSENYSLLYEYQNTLAPQEYVTRINEDGDEEEVYAPTISSNNSLHATKEEDKSWWAKVTQYPIKASMTIKGLLRPAILMSYVRVNIYLYGQKHINSGLYIITKQVDKIDGNEGYRTVLNMTRIATE